MRTASWVILVIVGALTLLASMASWGVAYFASDEQIGPTRLSQLAGGLPEVTVALRARRATAAAYAAGFSTLFLAITLGPYRRGDSWAWWALLVGTLVMSVGSLLRVPILGTRGGAGAPLITLVVVGLGLALDARRLRSRPPSS